MTSALSEVYPPGGGWTTDDLDELPEDGHRRELIDGVVIMSPSPTTPHQNISMLLAVALYTGCPEEFNVAEGVEVRVNRRRSLIPDVLATTAEAAARGPSRYEPHEVALVVEIVSPGSQTLDRFAKPALYAEAGIPFFWRIETDGGIVVHAYRLDPTSGVYQPMGTFTKVIKVDEPWPISIPMTSLTPRHFPPRSTEPSGS